MRRVAVVRVTAYLALAVAGLAACGSPGPGTSQPSPPTSSFSAAVSLPTQAAQKAVRSEPARPKRHEVASAVATLRRYLHAWVVRGPAVASRYLVSSQQVSSDAGAPRLAAATLTSSRVYGWEGSRELTLLVSLDLRFEGDPGAWNQGENERFVTAREVGARHRYVLELATSP